MRELIARPSGSRTVGITTISTAKSRSRSHALDDERLLGVLLAEEGELGATLLKSLATTVVTPSEVLGAAAARIPAEHVGEPAHLDRGREALGIDLLGAGRVDEVDARRLGEPEVPRLVARIALEVLAGAGTGPG